MPTSCAPAARPDRTYVYLCSSCRLPAGSLSHSYTEARLLGSCKSAHTLRCPRTSPALQKSRWSDPAGVQCFCWYRRAWLHGEDRKGKFVATVGFNSQGKDAVMKWGGFNVLTHQTHITGETRETVSSSLYPHCVNNLQCVWEYTYFFS